MSELDLTPIPQDDSRSLDDHRDSVVRESFFRPSYGILVVLYMAGITCLSSIPRDPATSRSITEVGLNLAHIPLFAGLTYLLVNSVVPRGRRQMPSWFYAAAMAGLVLFAAVDEWHQSFVQGRSASFFDLLLDTMGIGAVLLFYRLSDLVAEEP